MQSLVPCLFTGCHTAKTVNRKFETHIPTNETAQPQSQFLHSWFCKRFIYSHDQSAYSAAVRAASFLGVHKSDILCSACARRLTIITCQQRKKLVTWLQDNVCWRDTGLDVYLICLEVEFDVDRLVVGVDSLEGVGPVPVHVPVTVICLHFTI